MREAPAPLGGYGGAQRPHGAPPPCYEACFSNMLVPERFAHTIECYALLIDKISKTRSSILGYYEEQKTKISHDTDVYPGMLKETLVSDTVRYEYTSIYSQMTHINPFPTEVYSLLMSIIGDIVYINEIKSLLKKETHKIALKAIKNTYDGSMINRLIYDPPKIDTIERIKHTIGKINNKVFDMPEKVEKSQIKSKTCDSIICEIVLELSHTLSSVIETHNDDIITMQVLGELIIKSLSEIMPQSSETLLYS
jgi:hypothetical protein